MFNVGPGEVIIVALVLLIAVGPEQLPGVIRRVGRTVSQVRSMTDGLRQDFMAGMDEIERAADPKTWAEDEASAPSKVKPSNNIAAQNSSASLKAASTETPAVEPESTDGEVAAGANAEAEVEVEADKIEDGAKDQTTGRSPEPPATNGATDDAATATADAEADPPDTADQDLADPGASRDDGEREESL